MSTSNRAEQVSDFWGDEKSEVRKHNWLEHPVARAFINVRVSGDPAVGVAEHWRRTYLSTPAPLALSVGCGFGGFERDAFRMGLAERFEAIDISVKAVEQARAYAAEAGLSDRISYSAVDLEREVLPENRYDAIFGISSIHHVKDLEGLFRQCHRALKPGGLFFLEEYVGPSRFQSDPDTVLKINELLHFLPEHYRKSVYLNGRPRETYENTPLSWFDENDPSEAVRSGEIMPVLGQLFEIIENRPYGGALLHMVLSGTAGNFDPTIDSDVALLRVIALMEVWLEKAGALRSDFAAIVAKPK
jgi:2-polyprenyl-3-methyl-5-hydroxy-6-metoxy-1,4-benzoquinol methylase